MKASAHKGNPRSPEFRASGLANAATCIGNLSKGCRVIGLTKGQFSLIDIIRAVLDQTGPADVVLSTWSSGIRDIENAAWLLETGVIGSLRMLTDRSFPTRQPKYARTLVERFGSDVIHCTNTHAKFALIRNDGWDVAIRSSMNLNRNPRFEQFDLDESREICDFFAAFVDELEQTHPPGIDFDGSEVHAAFEASLGGTVEQHREAASLASLVDW